MTAAAIMIPPSIVAWAKADARGANLEPEIKRLLKP
jgi:hypothetical protein